MVLITSSARPDAVDYVQDGDEWVVVLRGSAELDVDGDPVSLGEGEWVHLPAGVPHRVTATAGGTRWLAIHSPPDDDDGDREPS